jgi:hypothetical protein
MSNQPTITNGTPRYIGEINNWRAKLSPVEEIRLGIGQEPALSTTSGGGPDAQQAIAVCYIAIDV